MSTKKAADSASVWTWIRVEVVDRDGRPMWFIPESKEPVLFPLHSFVGEARKKRAKFMNLEIVWSVFATEEFWTSARFFYRTLRELKRNTRLWGPPIGKFCACGVQRLILQPWQSKPRSLVGRSVLTIYRTFATSVSATRVAPTRFMVYTRRLFSVFV